MLKVMQVHPSIHPAALASTHFKPDLERFLVNAISLSMHCPRTAEADC